MPSDVTVIIAEPEMLNTLRADMHIDGRALFFSNSSLAQAFEAVRTHAPRFVALEAKFAASGAARAFVPRIDRVIPAGTTEIRVIARVDGVWRLTTPGEEQRVAAVKEPPAGASQVSLNTRRAPRFAVTGPIDAVIDGKAVKLVNVSVLGAQVVSGPALRPKQKIKVALPDVDNDQLRFAAHVAWASFERPSQDAQYRVGLEFDDAAAQALETYCQRHCASTPLPIR
jgi:hypothetical protein